MSSPFRHAFYVGNYFGGILYGVELTMYFSTLEVLHRRVKGSFRNTLFLVFSTALLALLTVNISTNAVWGEITLIDQCDQPSITLNVWYQILGSVSALVMTILGDALMIHRLFIIWGSCYWIILIPCLIYTAAIVLGVLQLTSAFSIGGHFFSGKAVDFGIPYYAIVMTMNVVITMLICGRLLYLSKRVKATLGPEDAKLYTSVASILIESAAPYTSVGVVYLVLYAHEHRAAIALGQIWVKLTCIAPQMIILRIVSGKAWTSDMTHRRTTSSRGHTTHQVFTTQLQLGEYSSDAASVEAQTLYKSPGAFNMV